MSSRDLPEDEFHRRAVLAWRRYCRANDLIYQQPDSTPRFLNGGTTIVLSNIRGELVRFRFKRTTRGPRIERVIVVP